MSDFISHNTLAVLAFEVSAVTRPELTWWEVKLMVTSGMRTSTVYSRKYLSNSINSLVLSATLSSLYLYSETVDTRWHCNYSVTGNKVARVFCLLQILRITIESTNKSLTEYNIPYFYEQFCNGYHFTTGWLELSYKAISFVIWWSIRVRPRG